MWENEEFTHCKKLLEGIGSTGFSLTFCAPEWFWVTAILTCKYL